MHVLEEEMRDVEDDMMISAPVSSSFTYTLITVPKVHYNLSLGSSAWFLSVISFPVLLSGNWVGFSMVLVFPLTWRIVFPKSPILYIALLSNGLGIALEE